MAQQDADQTVAIVHLLMQGYSDEEIASKIDCNIDAVATVRQSASKAAIPLTRNAYTAMKVKDSLATLIIDDEFAFFKRVRQATHCGQEYSVADRYCSRCGDQLQFPTVLEELLDYLADRLSSRLTDQTRREREEWWDMLKAIDSVARELDDNRVTTTEDLANSPYKSKDAIPLGKVSARLRHILVRENLVRFTDIERVGKLGMQELRNFGVGSLEELEELMSVNERDAGWLDR